MIEVEVESLLEAAQQRAEAQGALDQSMRGMQASQVGALGELVGIRLLRERKVLFTEVFSTQYDVAFIQEGRSRTMEFKTKERTVPPELDFDCTIPLYNHEHQKPDYYFFISLLSNGKSDDINRFTKAYILGVITLGELESVGVRWEAGQVDKRNQWSPTIDCINVKVSDLTPLG